MPAACRASRQAHSTSRGLGATCGLYHGRERHRFTPVRRATWSRNHRVRAAARTTRHVLAPLMRWRCRHCSGPSPSKAWASRMSRSPAQRSRSALKIASGLKDSSVVTKASTGGGGVRGPGVLGPRVASRRPTTTWRSRPGTTACHSPHHACTAAPAPLG
jgi:hypothetical protein